MKTDAQLNLEVGMQIRKIRESMHMTREQFGELCDISDSFLAAVESGKKSITTKTLYKICVSTGKSADDIIFGEDKSDSDKQIEDIFQNMEMEQLEAMTNAFLKVCEARKERA